MIKNRYQYVFVIASLMLIHVLIMFFWLGNIKSPSNVNALNTSVKVQKPTYPQHKPVSIRFTNY